MCGIYGYIGLGKQFAPSVLTNMGRLLAHRGPDDEGELVQNAGDVSLALGHKRLSIIDLSPSGRQPMSNEDGTIWVTLNGEIYNFRELREELCNKGHQFHSQSDTEVIVHLYEDEGAALLERIDGMFAFALWDSRQKLMLLARDRVGKKPLHYSVVGGDLAFASEIKALLQHPQVRRDLNLIALDKYLTFEYVPAPQTIFKSIQKLEPGHCLVWQKGKVSLGQYWDLPISDVPSAVKSESDYIAELRSLLDRSVRRRLVADVPVGLFISGGLDSALVAAFAKRAQDRLECFSIGFDEPSFDESQYSAQVARELDIEHHLKIFHAVDMLQMLQKLPDIIDEPLADPSIVPLYLLSQFASERIKVVLSGDGGDELFAGYQTYQALRFAAVFNAMPEIVKNTLSRIAARLPVSHDYLSFDFKLKQFLKGTGVAPEIGFFRWRGAFDDDERDRLFSSEVRHELGRHNSYQDIHRYIADSRLSKEFERILYLSMKLYLQDNNLVTVDRASMANGLEVRSPLLDKDLVEFACRLPTNLKLRGLTTKFLLKRAAEGFLPKPIIYRHKQGFGIPLAKWLNAELKSFMLDHLSEERIRRQGLFDYAAVKRLIDEQLSMTKDNREPLWTLLVFQSWYDRYLSGEGRCHG
ncbi:MAG TPA: asparagine synthase (glutamine-hydrolyzing) [Acidobacteriota bacterium]|nr:asparagine synthase (glutamine-hydrolyzing) [Acidobacteriota bacterium]